MILTKDKWSKARCERFDKAMEELDAIAEQADIDGRETDGKEKL